MKIIPAINCIDFSCVSHKFLEASKFLPKDGWLHIDIADARFTYNKTWNNPQELTQLFLKHPEFKFNLEVHLMVEEPEKEIGEWIKAGAKRIIVHLESLIDSKARGKDFDPKIVIAKIFSATSSSGAEVMLSTNPETKLENYKDYLDYFFAFQVLAVRPGLAGQKFLPSVIEKIKFLREQFSNAKIEVDGGINLEIGKLAKEAGADEIVVASYIFDSSDPKNKYEELLKI